MVNSEELVRTTGYLTVYMKCRVNRCRLNRVRLYSGYIHRHFNGPKGKGGQASVRSGPVATMYKECAKRPF
jgi:hypothetical protein